MMKLTGGFLGYLSLKTANVGLMPILGPIIVSFLTRLIENTEDPDLKGELEMIGINGEMKQ